MTKREARAFLAQVEGDKSRGLYVDPAGAQLRFRDLADRWWVGGAGGRADHGGG